MTPRWGRRVASSLFHYPHPPFDRLRAEPGVLQISNIRTHEVIDLGSLVVQPMQVQYRRIPVEARSVIVLRLTEDEEILFAPMRLKATAFALQDAGWEVDWRFRSATLRSLLARVLAWLGIVLPPHQPRWRPLFGPRAGLSDPAVRRWVPLRSRRERKTGHLRRGGRFSCWFANPEARIREHRSGARGGT